MRIALISDIHGNAVSLQHVLDDIEKQDVDQIAFLGDLATLGPSPRAVIEMVESLGCICIMGNHDEFLLKRNLICQYNPAPLIVDEVSWCRAQLCRDDLAFLSTFERSKRIQLSDSVELLLFHGSPHCHMDILLEDTDDDDVAELLGSETATIMAGGHTHLQMLRAFRGNTLLNPGSVGHPFVEFANGGVPKLKACAEYAVISAESSPDSDDPFSIELHTVPLDRYELHKAAAAVNNPMRTWLMSEYS